MRATMKRFVDMERTHGSLIAATALSTEDNAARGARYDLFRAPVGGISQLIESLTAALAKFPNTTIATNSVVDSIKKSDQRWTVNSDENAQSFDGLIVATGAASASRMLAGVDTELSKVLDSIETASSAIVAIGLNQSQLKRPFEGFGIIYPHIDGGQVIAISFSSNKFAGRCNEDQLLIRVFIGGAMQSELVDLDDESLFEIALAQLDKSVGLDGQPIFKRVFRWRNCMPQYHLGHVERVERIEKLAGAHANFALAGNSYHGVGIPACVESGKNAANKVLAKR
jgi:oxygen-dependent protoporphyrinogen oxidase